MAKKKVTSWKQKSQYTIIAPESFESQELGTTIASNPQNLMGRTIDVSLGNLTGEKSAQKLKLTFEIDNIQGEKAIAKFKKFKTDPGYMRSRVRKGMSKIDYVTKISLDSNASVQIKIMAVTHKIIQTSQKKDIIVDMSEILDGYKGAKLDDFLQAAMYGKLGTEIYHSIKKICPVRRVEVEEVRVL